MIKKLKIGLLIVALSFFIGASSTFAAGITYGINTTVYLSSPNLNLTILSGSVADTVVVNTGTLVVTVPASGVFTITSADKLLTATGQSQSSVVNTICANLAISQMTITAPASGAETVTITPSANACTVIVTNAGGGVYVPATPIVPTPVVVIEKKVVSSSSLNPAQISAIIVLLQSFNADPATIARVRVSLEGGTPSSSTSSIASTLKFTKHISKSIKSEVENLQKALNSILGQKLTKLLVVDGSWGRLTDKAIKQFQKEKGLTVDGIVGPVTRLALNKALGY